MPVSYWDGCQSFGPVENKCVFIFLLFLDLCRGGLVESPKPRPSFQSPVSLAEVELSNVRVPMLAQFAGEPNHKYAERKQVWSAGIATVLLSNMSI